MRLLLDTHVWLWLNLKPERIAAPCAVALAEPDNEIVVSVVSVWELGIKHKLGKIDIGRPFRDFVESAIEGVEVLGVGLAHVQRSYDLPLLHRDPFDRILVSQALVEGFTLVTVDAVMAQYGAPILPAA